MLLLRSNVHRAVRMAVAATVATCSIALTAPSPVGCPSTFNLFIQGTWETEEGADPSIPIGMLKLIADSLADKQGSAAQIHTLPYKSSGATLPLACRQIE